VATQKTLVTKVVGIGSMHISAKNRAKIRKFSVELAQTKLKLDRKPSEVLPGAILSRVFL
jgi:hypothetical protein